jgi:hypothetical protein
MGRKEQEREGRSRSGKEGAGVGRKEQEWEGRSRSGKEGAGVVRGMCGKGAGVGREP